MNRFDDIFRENVEKAFSNFKADHLADEGWNSFVRKRNDRRRIAIVIPLWARAASVVLIIGLGVFIADRISKRQIANEIISGNESAVREDEEPVTLSETTKIFTPAAVPMEENAHMEKQIEMNAGANEQAFADRRSTSETIPLTNEKTLITEITKSRLFIPDGLTSVSAPGKLMELQDDLANEDLISKELEPVNKEPDQVKHDRGRTILAGFSGLIAQSGSTFSPASGLSVGFYLDQKITKKLSVRPGIALARQSFGLENNNSTAEFNYPVSLNDGTNAKPYSFNGQLSILTMELPLNVVIRILDKKRSGLYVSTGASTMIYISQQFTADFVNEYTKANFNTMTGMYSYETQYSTVEVENNYGAFSRTDFFGLANLSAGYYFPYSKTGTMLIEPFLQLPVSDLTSLNLKVKYGGISLKLQFGKQEQGK